MKLIFFNVSEEERSFIQKWSFVNQIPVQMVSEGISSENIELVKGYDGICLYPSVEMRQSETIYKRLSDYGIRQLSIKSTGVDSVNFEWADKYNLTITNVPGYSPTSVGHFAIMSIMLLLRNVPLHMTERSKRKNLIGRELQDVTVGVLGTGRIGCVVAEGIYALGGNVLASSSRPNPRLKGIVNYVSFEELVKQSDVLSIHIPLNERSLYQFSDDVFAMMKPNACLVNTARGKIIDTNAMIDWLASGQAGGVALDAIENEEQYFNDDWTKNPFYKKLIQYPNVFLTPHVAFHTELAVKEITETALNNAKEILVKGESMNKISV
ncbi:D-lactate dehydrogenase [Enterococcus sp. DIV2402]|jgi:D-lactate dehydrogenase|uniref:D-lactate dehydrogenase n=1 Tax=Candidatus Enterococcus lowellii TaxID=2230877 RepID=A0ABZ2SMW1_9ENTE|nr:NAD(P)-dependent oxidoreductase [Enterococcus sp. DIV2402]MBO0464325.1 D-2-hydroxyacid dehydrogenase [Enterococcus sp. DIV2402]